MSQNELKPCRKCGELDYEFWDGYGTQAYLLCINCGSSEDIQVSDLYTIEERVAGVCDFEPAPSYMNKKEVIEKVNAELIKEWNTRASSSAPEAKELLEEIEERKPSHGSILDRCKAFIEATGAQDSEATLKAFALYIGKTRGDVTFSEAKKLAKEFVDYSKSLNEPKQQGA